MKQILAAALCLAAAGLTPLAAQDNKPEKKPAPSPVEAPAKKDAAADEGAELEIPVVEGVPVKGIKVPHYGPDGKLLMLFDAEVARKVDPQHLEMENLNIEADSDDGRKFYIALPRSIFNLETRILTGNSGVKIRREDFEITGDAGEFNTKTRFAKVLGNVKMIIFNTDNLDAQ